MPGALDIATIIDQHEFNLARWEEICDDPVLERIDHRIESDRFGHILMTIPPGIDHAGYQADLACRLGALLPGGKVLTECPISTGDGIKAADVAWISRPRFVRARKKNVLIKAPEICAEVLSHSNTREEIEHKRRLYFEAGAVEVWICSRRGRMVFFHQDEPGKAAAASLLCPKFPKEI
jgi:Uma2 family endonuclease